MVRVSLCTLKFKGENPKKGLRYQILGSVLALPGVFRPETKFYHGGGHEQYFGGSLVPKCTPVAPGLLLSFGAQSSLRGDKQ